MHTSSIKVDGMLLMLLLSFCTITIHGFIFQDALNIAECLAVCKNVSHIINILFDIYTIYFIS